MEAITRILKLRSLDWEVDVPVRIFWPVEDKGSWFCRWEIDWPDRKRSNMAGGVDGVQALRLALEMIGATLHYSDEHGAGALRWNDGANDYGFPLPPCTRGGLSDAGDQPGLQ